MRFPMKRSALKLSLRLHWCVHIFSPEINLVYQATQNHLGGLYLQSVILSRHVITVMKDSTFVVDLQEVTLLYHKAPFMKALTFNT